MVAGAANDPVDALTASLLTAIERAPGRFSEAATHIERRSFSEAGRGHRPGSGIFPGTADAAEATTTPPDRLTGRELRRLRVHAGLT
jgi:hypothetical protein